MGKKHGPNSYAFYMYICLYRLAFNSSVNAAVVTRLVKEVQTLNPRYQANTIKGKHDVFKYITSLWIQLLPILTTVHCHKRTD